MRVAILCPGPSLGMFEVCPRGPYEAILAVNQAIEAYRADWWVFKDKWIFYEFEPKAWPKGICSLGAKIEDGFNETEPATSLRLVRKEFDPKKVEEARKCVYRNIGDWEFNGFKGHGDKSPDVWKRFTIGPAFMLAYQLGASEIHVYGADMEGAEDYKGRGPRRDTDRDEERWDLERSTWNTIVGWLDERGITVERIVK